MTPLPFDAPLPAYQSQAEKEGGALSEGDNARAAVARFYDFRDWDALEVHVRLVHENPAVARFERAVEAVIDGDAATLRALLAEDAGLVRARSARVTHFDPPIHGATLLHYVACNGVENFRQRSPANAGEIARILLDAGADVNALCDLYGGRCTALSLLVSSEPPAKAGTQIPVMHVLIDAGAALTPAGEGHWTSPIETALVFGFVDTARALVGRGAPVDTVAAAAGLGLVDDLRRLLPASSSLDRHRAVAIASLNGQVETVRTLLDAGEDPNRFNPPGTHAHTMPIHQACLAGHLDVVKLLVERGARLDVRDTIHSGTPLGWAEYGGHREIAEFLRSRGAA